MVFIATIYFGTQSALLHFYISAFLDAEKSEIIKIATRGNCFNVEAKKLRLKRAKNANFKQIEKFMKSLWKFLK